ncbi:MAG: hypothetical protein KBS62_06255 [Oscillospiraceae bacterium]|nr:hypothetical protein [Candidatus Ruminococcus equi]
MKKQIKKINLKAISFAIILALCIIPIFGMFTAGAIVTNPVETFEKGLVLYAPSDVTVNLYGGLPARAKDAMPEVRTENLVQKSTTETKGDITYHYYYNLPARSDGYHYKVSGDGYYTVISFLYFPEEKASKINEINVDPGKMAGNGYEQTCILLKNSDELLEKVAPINPEWKTKYPYVYDTPTIKAGNTKANHEFTTQAEMEEFIHNLDTADDDMYYYSLTKTPTENSFDIPLLVFTQSDLSDCKGYVSAATEVKKNGKPTIMYQAQIHGNEPAGGEGCLAVIEALDGEYGKKVLKDVNLVVIPRVNPDGSKEFSRDNGREKFDMNRDHIKVQSVEIDATHKAYNLFLPQAVLDGHEYYALNFEQEDVFKDVLLGVGGGYNTTERLTQTGVKAVNSVIKGLNAEGLRTTYYSAPATAGAVKDGLMVNTANFSTGRGYYSLKGCISLLIETKGIHIGKQSFERRVVGQYVAVTSLINYIAENREEILASVEYEREHIKAEGMIFDENNLFGLYTGSEFKNAEYTWNPTYDYLSGELTSAPDVKSPNYYYDKAEKSRPRTTAYVVPKNAQGSEAALEIIKKHDIYYYEVEPGTTIRLRQYGGEVTPVSGTAYFEVKEATLSEETDFTFDEGAYVFPTNQVSGTLLMYLFEPDVQDTSHFGSGFCQNKTLRPEDIYRYEHDLEDDGTVYTGSWDTDQDEDLIQTETASPNTGDSFTANIWRCILCVIVISLTATVVILLRKKFD